MQERISLSPQELKKAIEIESRAFEENYLWLEAHMPASFLNVVDHDTRVLIARNLMSFALQDHFTPIYFKHKIIVLSEDAPDADLKVFKKFRNYAIRYYRAFVSNAPPPCDAKGSAHLRVALLYFHDLSKLEKIDPVKKAELYAHAREHNHNLQDEAIEELVRGITPNFLKSMAQDRLALALEMFFRAKNKDLCQYEVRRNEDWEQYEAPSLQIVMAWRNVSKSGFLYRLAKVINAHHLAIQKVVGTYIDTSPTETILILSLGLHGKFNQAAWEAADIDDFLREFVLTKYFDTDDPISAKFTETGLLTGNEAYVIRNFVSFTHQVLVYKDPHFYSYDNVMESVCRHPELTVRLAKAFELKFHPEKKNLAQYEGVRKTVLELVDKLDTGQVIDDIRRKTVLRQSVYFIDHTLKTNFYQDNKSSFGFRLDPGFLDHAPFDRKERFPELPYGIFFIRGMYFIGFNVRFKDLARGGVRTVIPESREQHLHERNTIFSEAYHLAYTQHKKNKDIPEGGAKTAILLEPFDVFQDEIEMFKQELRVDGIDPLFWEEKLNIFQKDHKTDYLFASQKSFMSTLVELVNCEEDGKLRGAKIVDYWQKPEYIYLGPDENMFNEMLTWIADLAVRNHYKPGRTFISGKPGGGVNHKQYGVTSYGVNVYLHEMLIYLGMDPTKDPFTVKISGGPDGDVAGNEIVNLYKYYPNTAKLLALTDVSGTIYDPEGLDLKEMAELFSNNLPIRSYPTEKLHDGGFLLDVKVRREESAYAQQTLLWRKIEGKTLQEWISGNDMHHLYRSNVHQVKADVFIPAGGRPRTLNENNYHTFLDETGKPTARAIIEGANLYLTHEARRALEKLGVLIFKDSTCNKGGVICSSFEVLISLCEKEEAFIKEKDQYVKEILAIIGKAALNEAKLIIDAHQKTGEFFTELSEKVSEKINLFKYQLLDYLEKIELKNDALIACLLKYAPPLLREKHTNDLLKIPDIHKKAIISCYLASHLVYKWGLQWSPTIADVLPMIAEDPEISGW